MFIEKEMKAGEYYILPISKGLDLQTESMERDVGE